MTDFQVVITLFQNRSFSEQHPLSVHFYTILVGTRGRRKRPNPSPTQHPHSTQIPRLPERNHLIPSKTAIEANNHQFYQQLNAGFVYFLSFLAPFLPILHILLEQSNSGTSHPVRVPGFRSSAHREGSIMITTSSPRLIRLCYAFFFGSLVLAGPGETQTFFTKDALNDSPFWMRGIGWGDYDNDGWPDLLFSENANKGRIKLLKNAGNGPFIDQTVVIQADILPGRKGGGVIFGDYDNDGDLDLYVSVGFGEKQGVINMLLRNDRGIFKDVTVEAGLTDVQPTDNAIWLDYDRDGNIDLYTGDQGGPEIRNNLYRNTGDGTFTDVTVEAGLDVQLHPQGGGSNGGMAAGDFNDDGWPDLYMGVYDAPNRLFLNNGQGGFQDATTSEIADEGEAFGVAVGDIDHNGTLDIFQAAGGGIEGVFRSLMLLNRGEGVFLDVLEGVGLSALGASQTLGSGLADIDNDGDLDLLVAYPHCLFVNNGDGTFTDRTAQSGIEDVALTVSLGDYDLDGFLDVWFGTDADYFNPSLGRLYRNQGNENHYLRVELAGVESNRNGIGARLMATAGDVQQMREIFGGRGYEQDEMVAHFGLGERTQVDQLKIRWPSGQVDVLTDIPVDQKIRIFEGREGYHVVHPTVWISAPPGTLVVGSRVELKTVVQPALFEEGAEITRVRADLSRFGSSDAVPLTDVGDGTYILEPASLSIEDPNGFRTISVMIDQHTSLGPYWINLSKTIAVFPDRDLRILDEGLAGSWQIEGSVSVESMDLAQKNLVYQGDVAGIFQVKPESRTKGWSVLFQPDSPVGTLGFTAVRFAFHPGDVRGAFVDVLNFTVGDQPRVQLALGGHVDLEVKDWQVVEVPLADFALDYSIESIRFSGNLSGTFYLDDIRLVAVPPPPSATAVTEDHTATLPQSITLSQNYPNPFNSDTVIRFALPTSADVDLSIFNLAGQQVATLVEESREAGTYTIRWDGRDDDGRELASGVYLFRLRTSDGKQVETRKLVLVR